jgi:DNA primase
VGDLAAAIRARLCNPRVLMEALGRVDGPGSFQLQAGGGLTVRCPWHNERSPSLSVTVGRDGTVRARCFGCQASGDALDLVAAVHGLDPARQFRRVLELAAQLAGIAPGETPAPFRPPPRPAEPPPLEPDAFHQLARVVAEHGALDRHPDVARYLAARGLLEEARGELFALPGNDRGLRSLRAAIEAAIGADGWKRSGLARADGTWSFAAHRLVIPWRAPGVAGAVLTLQRRLVRDARPGEPKYVFPRGRQPWHPFGADGVLERAPADSPVLYVEGALDALALRTLHRRRGVERVVLALPGLGWRTQWAEYARGRVAILAFDADDAGDAAVPAIAADLHAAGAVAVKRARPTHSKDWAELTARSCA